MFIAETHSISIILKNTTKPLFAFGDKGDEFRAVPHSAVEEVAKGRHSEIGLLSWLSYFLARIPAWNSVVHTESFSIAQRC